MQDPLPHPETRRRRGYSPFLYNLLVFAPMKLNVWIYALVFAVTTAPAVAADGAPSAADDANAVAAPASKSYVDRASELVVQALTLIGIKYTWGGNDPEAGLDCSGLVSHVFNEVAGIVLPRDSRSMSKVGAAVDKTELQPGDLVFFNTLRKPFSHVGIYIGENRFVHAPRRGREVEISELRDRYWQKRFNGARRVQF
jgi:cell wall-associated NlpC family hydrolase